jgi:serine/threonine protein kinase
MSHDADADFIALQTALAGEYSLDRELGRGGMGIVYLAREVRLARPVAIKVLPPSLASRAPAGAATLPSEHRPGVCGR